MTTFGNYVFFVILPVLGMMSAASGNDEFKTEMLRLHNAYRIKHGAPKLILDDGEMSKDAMKLARKLINGSTNPRGEDWRYGDNFYSLGKVYPSYKVTADRVFLSWYNNGRDYKYLEEPKMHTFRDSFTQIVWQSTTHMGLATLENNNGTFVVVATYFPPGNELGQYTNNVIEPKNI